MVQIGGPGHNNPEKLYDANLGEKHLFKIIEIGDWDMDTDATKAVAHGETLTDIRMVQALIRNDANDTLYPLLNHDGAAASAMVDTIDATNVNLLRANGGDFDKADFDSTSYNRGWLAIWTKD